jgi:voltage-gated sodium channel
VIVLNAIALGLETYDFSNRVESALTVLDGTFLGIFVVELAIRIAAYGRRPQDFFKEGWNVFDFVVIGLAFVPGLRQNVTLLRLARLLRVVRLVSVMPDLRILVRAMARSLPPITSLVMLTVLLMYIYGMVGWILFHEEDPEQWGNIGQSLLSLFQILTLENWPQYLERGQAIHPASWIFFVSYVLIASFLVINILIAIIINSMEEVHDAEREEERRRRGEKLASGSDGTVAERLDEIRSSLDRLEAQLAEGGGDLPGPARSVRRPTKGGRMRA